MFYSNMTGVLIQRGNSDIGREIRGSDAQRKEPCEVIVRRWPPVCQAGWPQKKSDLQHLDFRFQASRTVKK